MKIFTCTANPEHEVVGVLPKFCSECGAKVFHQECPCGNLLVPGQKFCERCGISVDACSTVTVPNPQ